MIIRDIKDKREERRKIDKFVNENIKKIKKILKMDFSHTEEY